MIANFGYGLNLIIVVVCLNHRIICQRIIDSKVLGNITGKITDHFEDSSSICVHIFIVVVVIIVVVIVVVIIVIVVVIDVDVLIDEEDTVHQQHEEAEEAKHRELSLLS